MPPDIIFGITTYRPELHCKLVSIQGQSHWWRQFDLKGALLLLFNFDHSLLDCNKGSVTCLPIFSII